MRNSYFNSVSNRRKSPFAEVDKIRADCSESSLPQSKFSLEIKSRGGNNNCFRPKKHADASLEQSASVAAEIALQNQAFELLKYQLGDRQTRQRHHQNLQRNLQHRLGVARTQNNPELVNALQMESQHLKVQI